MQSQNQTERVGYEALAIAIIEQAAVDYRLARRTLAKPAPGPDADAATVNEYEARQRMAHRMMHEVEQFFRSEWQAQLTRSNGREILRRLQQERIKA
jgi:hypothetical protein